MFSHVGAVGYTIDETLDASSNLADMVNKFNNARLISSSDYHNLEHKNPSTIYYIENSNELFLGDNLLTQKIDSDYALSSSLSNDQINRLEYDYDKIFKEIVARFSQAPVVEHKCHNCGATLEIDSNKHIFRCPYCHSVYAIGTQLING